MRRADADQVLARRTRLLYWMVAAVVSVFLGRLYLLQVVSGEKYRGVSQSNSVKVRAIPAPRGLIRDRHGRLLVGNRDSSDLVLDREAPGDPEVLAAWLGRLTAMPPGALDELLKAHEREPKFRPIVVAEDLAFSQVAYYEARREDVPQLSLETRTLREYPHDELGAHVLGYVGEVSEAELEKGDLKEYKKPRDLVGKAGVEQAYDRFLSGVPGRRHVVVNNLGREISETVAEPPVRGKDLVLTIDLEVQRAAEHGLAGRRGAAVLLDVRDGQVLALASSPPFEPSAFVAGISAVRWKQYVQDSRHPLRFRAVAGTYPPGSTWKPLVSTAALETGKHSRSFAVTCRGGIEMWGKVRHCWKKEGHGTVDMHDAFVHSCNVYYYTAGRDVTEKPIVALAQQIGFGRKTGIDVPGEVSGTLPSDEWKRARFKDRWYPGDTINFAIGQGFLGVTPLQVAEFAAAIASGGDVWRPHVLSHALDPVTGEVVERAAPELLSHVNLSRETLAFLHKAMEDTVNYGTGGRARIPGLRVAGKTGTAQAVAEEVLKSAVGETSEAAKTHAWFMGFAPVERPEVAFAVVLEHVGAHGGEAAAPVAREMLETWFGARVQVTGQ